MIKVIIIITKFIIAVTIALLLNSCNIKTEFRNGKEGSGKISTETRAINEDFSSIDVNSAIEVVLEQSNEQFISVTADENLQQSIDTKVENGVLKIEPNESINPTQTVKIIVRMPKIEGLEASSSSKIKGIGTFKGESISIDVSSAAEVDVNLKYDDVNLDASSGSNIRVKGLTLKLESSASSGSEIEANQMFANEVTADVSSGGIIKTHPILSLNGNASSGGRITYNIEPKSITKDESSGGNVGRE